jgi:hypothetical protein
MIRSNIEKTVRPFRTVRSIWRLRTTSAMKPLRGGNQGRPCGHRPFLQTSATTPSADCSLAGSVNVAHVALCGCLVVAETTVPISGFTGIADIAIRFRDHMALSRDEKKLFPHFGEAGPAVFAVKEVEYGGHDRIPLFDHTHSSISLGGRRDLDHTPGLLKQPFDISQPSKTTAAGLCKAYARSLGA